MGEGPLEQTIDTGEALTVIGVNNGTCETLGGK